MTETQTDQKHLVGRTARSSTWVICARLLVRFSDLILLVILSRFLVPADFGLVTIASSVVAILELVTEVPLPLALVRLESIRQRHLDTAFTIGVLRSLMVIGIMAAAAGPIAAFYDDPRLVSVLLVLSLFPVARVLQSPALARLHKELSFRQTFLLETLGKVIGLATAVTVGMLTHSYWALVVSRVVSGVSSAALSYYFAPCRVRLSLSEIGYFWGFLGWLFPAQMLNAVSWQFDRLFLGNVVAAGTMGYYGLANTIASLLEESIRNAVNSPLTAGFSIAGSDRDRLCRGFLMAANVIFMLGLPVYILTFFFAEPLVALVLGPDWAPVAPLLQGLAIAFLPALVRLPFHPLAMAAGKTNYIFYLSIVMLTIRLPMIYLGWQMGGIAGVIAGLCLAALFNAAMAMELIRRLTGMGVGQQFRASGRFIAAMLPSSALAWALAPVLTDLNGVLLFAGLAGAITAAGFVYAAMVYAIWHVMGKPWGIEEKIVAMIVSRIRVLRLSG